MSDFVGKDDFEAVDDREFAEVETPWSSKKIRLRSLNASEVSEVTEFIYDQTSKQKKCNYNLCMLGQMVCDGEGLPIFSSIEEGEKVLEKRSPKVIKKLLAVARKLTPLTDADWAALEVVEKVAGNSETPPADSSIA